MTVYMEVTKDKYELAVAVADTAQRLAELRGVSVFAIKKGIARGKQGIKTKYRKVVIED